jgi:ketosteroid isomerase-like protein
LPKDFGPAVQRLRDARTAAPSAEPAITPQIRSIEEQLAAIARGDFAAAVADAVDDVSLEIFAPPEFPFVRQARGRDEFIHAMKTNFGALENQQPEIGNVVAQGDTVVLVGRERGTFRETGAAYSVEFVHRFTFREGRLAAVRIIAAKSL